MFDPGPFVYMNKLAVGPEAKGHINIEKSITENLKAIAKATHKDVEDLTTIVLDRDRHKDIIAEIRQAGARIRQIPDGDVAAALMTAWPNSGVDVLIGVGGTPEGVPPTPIKTSTPESGQAVINAAATSPSGICRMRAPAWRISAMISLWRSRSRTMVVRSSTSLCMALAMALRFSVIDFSILMTPLASGPTASLFIYTNGPGSNIVPRGAIATVASEFERPNARGRVPSIGSTATSTSGAKPLPTFSPLYNIGALSFSPSPMTMIPFISTVWRTIRIALTAAPSAASLSPRPIKRPAASAAASVTRASSRARFRVGSLLSQVP